MHGGGHLVHGRGDLFGFLFLAADLQISLLGHRRQRLSGAGQLFDTRLQATDDAAKPRPHLLHRLHQLADLVPASHLDRGAQIACRDLLGNANHPTQRSHDQTSDDQCRDQPDQQGQCQRSDDQQGVLFQLGLHRMVFGDVSLVDALHHLGRALIQLPVYGFFLNQEVCVFREFFTETADMPHHFIEDCQVTLILDRGFQLLGLGQRLVGLFDLALGAVVALAALIQAHARFVHGLQHQPRYLADLAGLLDELGAVLAFGILQGIGAIIGEARLQYIEIVGDAGHRPTGHFQRQILGLAEGDKLVKGLAISRQGLFDIVHHRDVGRRLLLELIGQGNQPIDALAQGRYDFRVAMQGVLLLEQTHLEQAAVKRRHLLETIETLADGLQGPDANGGDQRRQQQHQHKADTQFFRHTEVGKTSLHGRNHCT
ncbi:hypothetical protein D3C73_941630 [compost metagenome]